jgi:putative NIF3 family GTP cyclohydrolase 1 type 2
LESQKAFVRDQRQGPAVSDLTALQLIQRIVAQTGASNRAKTVDQVSAGDPTQAVNGIAVTSQASLSALHQAARVGANLVLTYDPVFWANGDDLTRMETDALFLEKRDVIRAHNMVVFTLQEHLRDSVPDRIAQGMAQALGWQPEPGNANLFRRPPTSLLALAQELGARLDDKTLRVVGDPTLAVSTVATSFGNTQQMPGIALLNGPIDVLVAGYAREWEVVEYAQDMIAAGAKKALVLLGENASVQAGMKSCAEWIKTFVTEMPVHFIALPEPYWNV